MLSDKHKIKLALLLDEIEKSELSEGDKILIGSKAYFRAKIENIVETYTEEEIVLEDLLNKTKQEFEKAKTMHREGRGW